MISEDAITAKIYDPLLYFALRNIRREIIGLIDDRDARILDLCCGTGNQLKKLRDAGFSALTGVDLSPEMLRVAAKGGKIARLLEADVRETGLGDNGFDIIIISFAVHEKSAGVQARMLAEADRLLAPSGQILLVDFSLDEQARRIGKIGAHMIERLAGKEHYGHFKAYVRSGGMPHVIRDGFKVQRQIRHGFGVVSIWVVTGPDTR